VTTAVACEVWFRGRLQVTRQLALAEANSIASAELHGRIKNRARAIADALTLPSPTGAALALSKAQELVLETEALRRQLAGLPSPPATIGALLADVLDDLLPERLREGWLSAPPETLGVTLTGRDAELARLLVADLVTNAARAQAGSAALTCTCLGGHWRLDVWDDCEAEADQGWWREGSLGVLRATLESYGGGISLSDTPPRGHRVVAQWPVAADRHS
jgi:hypothetical protein